jgi:DivIVA domain-containing protein
MPLTPEDVRNRRFKTAFRGYDETEVDTFLDEVEVELTRLLGEQDTLRQRLQTAQAAPPPQAQPERSEAEEMLRRTLLLAQRTADETVAEAKQEAERLTGTAREHAESMLRQAQEQAAAAISDLETRRQALEQHIEGLRAFEREYRTRLKAYLESQLRDLDGRGQPAGDGAPPAPPSLPPSVPPPVPPMEQPAAPPVPPFLTPTVPESGPAAVPSFATGSPGDVPDVSYGDDEPEPFDIDEGGDGVPRLAP